LLRHVIERSGRTGLPVIVATPDSAIAEMCCKWGVSFFVGSEHDVLDRYFKCAVSHRAERIVRVTADNPFVDPELILAVVKEPGMYVCNNLPPTYPVGLDVEAFTREALRQAWVNCRDDYGREHVTPWMRQNLPVLNLPNSEDLSAVRLTVDTPEDLEKAQGIYARFRDNGFSWRDVLT
jgi:spore coat polysaccharide biosynthesis protein SpsF (cytidylyltransferase family)